MRSRFWLSALAAATCLVLAAHSAAAQQASPPAAAAAPAAPSITPAKWDAKPVGTYDLELALPERVMQAKLTISEQAGALVANFWPVGDNDGHDMTVTVKDTDLVLDADAPRGHVQMVLQHEKDRIAGRWSFAEDKGTLQGKITH